MLLLLILVMSTQRRAAGDKIRKGSHNGSCLVGSHRLERGCTVTTRKQLVTIDIDNTLYMSVLATHSDIKLVVVQSRR